MENILKKWRFWWGNPRSQCGIRNCPFDFHHISPFYQHFCCGLNPHVWWLNPDGLTTDWWLENNPTWLKSQPFFVRTPKSEEKSTMNQSIPKHLKKQGLKNLSNITMFHGQISGPPSEWWLQGHRGPVPNSHPAGFHLGVDNFKPIEVR